MGGRYSDGVPNIDIYLKGHSGSPISTDRIGREGGSIRNPAVTVCLAIQPDVIMSLRDKKGFRERGLLARFIWSIPRSRVGSRAADSPPVPEDVRRAYEHGVTSLLAIPAERDEWGEITSCRISLTGEAHALLVEFKQRIEPSLGPSGELECIADWGNKLAGTVVRLAGLLHLADRAWETSEGRLEPVGEGEMRRAIRIAEFLTHHALIAFDLMEPSRVVRSARHILAWIERTGSGSFTRRDAYRASRALFRSPAEMAPALELLADHEVIRPRTTAPRIGPGRPPSPVFDVNPAVLGQSGRNPVPGPLGCDSVNSVHEPGRQGSDSCVPSQVSRCADIGGSQR